MSSVVPVVHVVRKPNVFTLLFCKSDDKMLFYILSLFKSKSTLTAFSFKSSFNRGKKKIYIYIVQRTFIESVAEKIELYRRG